MNEEVEAARTKVRAVSAVRLVLEREQEIVKSHLAWLDRVRDGKLYPSEKTKTVPGPEVRVYWETKGLVLERMVAMLDQSRAANEAVVNERGEQEGQEDA